MEQKQPVIIETKNLTKRYGDKVVVNQLNLSIHKGEIFGLLGPNGAGKTTTILMLLGLTEPLRGSAMIGGMDCTKNPLGVKGIVGYLPDNVGFYADMTGKQNLCFTGQMNGLSDEESEARAIQLLKRVGLESRKYLYREYKDICTIASCPFSKQSFYRMICIYAGESAMAKRSLKFGSLYIDQYRQEIRLNEQRLMISPAEYEILLALIKHLGEVLSRDRLNQYLPERRRNSLRNIDTHIKNIRRKTGGKDFIKCIRSVGYCVPAENICREFRNNTVQGLKEAPQ